MFDVGNFVFAFIMCELFCAGWLFNIFWTQNWAHGGRPLAVGLWVLFAFLVGLMFV